MPKKEKIKYISLVLVLKAVNNEELKITYLISKLLECDTCYYRNGARNYSSLIRLINLNSRRIRKLKTDVLTELRKQFKSK